MPSNTYVSLATITLTSTDTEIIFASIPATYRDLVLVVHGRSTYTSNADDSVALRFNGDGGSNYPAVLALGYSGGTFSNTSNTNRLQPFVFPTSSSSNTSPGEAIIQIMDYSASDKHKPVIGRGNSVQNTSTSMTAGRWASNTPINSISVFSDRYLQGGSATSFAIGSTFSLWGISA